MPSMIPQLETQNCERLCYMNKLLALLLLFSPLNAFAGVDTNGTTQYLKASSVNFGLNTGTELTVAGWFDLDYTNDFDYLLATKMRVVATADPTFHLEVQDGDLCAGTNAKLCVAVELENGTTVPYFISSFNSISASGKHFVAFTWKRSAGTDADFSFYVDGTAQTPTHTGTYNGSFALSENSNEFYISSRNNNGTNQYYTDGRTYELYMWNKQLTTAELDIIYKSKMHRVALQVEPASLIGSWELNQCADGATCTSSSMFSSLRAGSNLSPTGSPTGAADKFLSYP